MRTSSTHPLQIAEIQFAEGYGKVGLTFCPGKKQSGALTGDWDRDLALDLDRVVEWKAAVVISLLEDHEFERLGVPWLSREVQDRHMEWRSMPIRDVSIPDKNFELAWRIDGEGLRGVLRAGFNILVHCKGGLGRAGMIAARLLIELGMDPAEAVEKVRQVRPGAIQTAAQLDYVMKLAAVPGPVGHQSRHMCEERAVGAMLGLAVGDAIGTSLEFHKRDSVPRVEDMIGGGPFRLEPGQWTDDTAMALALMDSLLAAGGLDEEDLMTRFVDWHENGTYSCTGSCFDIGITTSQALSRWKKSGNPFSGSVDPNTAGNGSLMRLAPVAIRYWRDHLELRAVAARQSRTTHGAPEAVDACIAFAEILADAIAGLPRHEVLRPRSGYEGQIETIMAGSWRGKDRDQISTSGYVAHSLEAALWCVGRTSSFTGAVLLAANLGDDADTTAAITGQLAGALYGACHIPSQWKDELSWGGHIAAKTEELFEESLPN